MKSEMPYRGVPTPLQQQVYRAVFPRHPLASFEAWRDTVLGLWNRAEYREERYAALALPAYRRYAAFRTLDALPLYEHPIVSGAWGRGRKPVPLMGFGGRGARPRLSADVRPTATRAKHRLVGRTSGAAAENRYR